MDATPTHATITVLEQELTANAKSVPSHFIGDQFMVIWVLSWMLLPMLLSMPPTPLPVFAIPPFMEFPSDANVAGTTNGGGRPQ